VRRPALFSRETFWFGFWLAGVGLVVLCYNTWQVCCGACSLEAMTTLGWHGWLLVLANLVGLGMLILLKLLTHLRDRTAHCGCGRALKPGWHFCPECGKGIG